MGAIKFPKIQWVVGFDPRFVYRRSEETSAVIATGKYARLVICCWYRIVVGSCKSLWRRRWGHCVLMTRRSQKCTMTGSYEGRLTIQCDRRVLDMGYIMYLISHRIWSQRGSTSRGKETYVC
jgi:hypothetical protein